MQWDWGDWVAEIPLRFELPHARNHVAAEESSRRLHVACACSPMAARWLPVLLHWAVACDVHARDVRGLFDDSAPVLQARWVES